MMQALKQLYRRAVPYETRLLLYKWRHQAEFIRLRHAVNPSPKGDFSLRPFDEHRCIFIHITKTAGTSVATGLFGHLPYHYTAIDYRVIYGRKIFERYFKFAFVRNPWDRLYSAYRYLKAGGWNEEDRLWAERYLSEYVDFNDFVCNWLTSENIKTHLHFRPQCFFICDPSGKPLIDYMAYFETINDDFEYISGLLDLDASIPHHNANPGKSYREAYNETSKEIVAKIYHQDISLLGYSFDKIERRHPLGNAKDQLIGE